MSYRTKVKYVVHPGWVTSAHDGDRHYIEFYQLVRLYGVNPIECIDASSAHAMLGWSDEVWATFKHLNPRYDGNYDGEL